MPERTDRTPRELSRIARGLYADAPLLTRTLMSWRPYICPFETLIAEVPPGARVLDVGCGSGLFLGLRAQVDCVNGIGFDTSEKAIRAANAMRQHQSGASNLRFLSIDAKDDWPGENGSFGVVSMVDVMHHLPQGIRREVIRRACARVAPGGVFLYKDMCIHPAWRRGMNRLHDLLMARQWIHEEPIGQVEAWAREEGMELVREDRINRWWYGHELRVFRKPSPSESTRP